MRNSVSAIVAAALLGALAFPAEADRVIRKRSHHHSSWTSNIQSGVKLGVYMPEASGESSGFFGGLEMANISSQHIELLGTGDYFYRSRGHEDGVRTELDLPYDIPVEEVSGGGRSYAHLGQVGVAVRLKAGTGPQGPQPFVQVGANLQLLHLRAREVVDGGRHTVTRSDTFAGIGWQVGVGLVQPIDRHLSFLGEAGYNHAEPKQWEEGYSTLVAKASGGYFRLGLRFGR